MKYFIANWKANKNLKETKEWVDKFSARLDQDEKIKEKLNNDLIKIIVCPPFPLLYPLKEFIKGKRNIAVGCQDISRIDHGTYTGEVTAYSLMNIAEFAVIGHSERKKYFHETEEDSRNKYNLARKYGIEPIYCIPDADTVYPNDVTFLCYEPPAAISTGDARGNYESVENILKAKEQLNVSSQMVFIYGGSVNKDNAAAYLNSNEIDGFLSGGASLNPIHFYQIISLA